MWLHDLGWRAQRVRVEAILQDDIPEGMLPTTKREIADAYGIPIITPGEYEAFCQERELTLLKGPDG